MANLKTLVSASITAGLLSAGVAHAADGNPFQSQTLDKGFMLADNHAGKTAEGKCGGDKKAEGSCGGKKAEGKCGGDKKAEGACGGKTKAEKKKDGKCGEGKCGARMKKDAPAEPKN